MFKDGRTDGRTDGQGGLLWTPTGKPGVQRIVKGEVWFCCIIKNLTDNFLGNEKLIGREIMSLFFNSDYKTIICDIKSLQILNC